MSSLNRKRVLPLFLFKVVYYIVFVLNWKENWAVARRRKQGTENDRDRSQRLRGQNDVSTHEWASDIVTVPLPPYPPNVSSTPQARSKSHMWNRPT